MHPRVQKFQMGIFGHLCALQSSCEHSECCQMAHCQYVSHFARPPSSETQFPMTKHDPRLVPKSPSLDARRAKRTIGADLHASPNPLAAISTTNPRLICARSFFHTFAPQLIHAAAAAACMHACMHACMGSLTVHIRWTMRGLF